MSILRLLYSIKLTKFLEKIFCLRMNESLWVRKRFWRKIDPQKIPPVKAINYAYACTSAVLGFIDLSVYQFLKELSKKSYLILYWAWEIIASV